MPGKNSLPGSLGKSESQRSEQRKEDSNRTERSASKKESSAAENESKRAVKNSGAAENSRDTGAKKAFIHSQDENGQILQKRTASGLPVNRSSLQSLAKETKFSQNLSAGKDGEAPTGQTIPARAVFMQAAAAMGFPKDTLSIALLAFARFFSLSLNPALMGALRRDILATGKQSSPHNAKGKAALEAEALAACLALDKGAALDPETLERYSHFLTFSQPEDAYTAWQDNGEGESQDRDEAPTADEISKIAENQTAKEDFLNYLNVLPGKNGRYWVVKPFKLKVKGTELTVILRLLKREAPSLTEGERAIADIVGPKRQWRCFLEKRSGKFCADIRVFPDVSASTLGALLKEAEHFMGKQATDRALFGDFLGFDEIRIANGMEAASWVDDLCDELLPSIDEEV